MVPKRHRDPPPSTVRTAVRMGSALRHCPCTPRSATAHRDPPPPSVLCGLATQCSLTHAVACTPRSATAHPVCHAQCNGRLHFNSTCGHPTLGACGAHGSGAVRVVRRQHPRGQGQVVHIDLGGTGGPTTHLLQGEASINGERGQGKRVSEKGMHAIRWQA